jgi:hypothetical protein
MFIFIDFNGNFIWNYAITQMSFSNANNSNGMFSYISVESNDIIIPGNYKFVKFPVNPQYVYKG